MMDVRLLRYFLAIVRQGTITKAAQTLHIAQPSLSKQMMDLEQEIGKPLFIRGKRNITLTPEGMMLRKRAEEIIALVEKTEKELKNDENMVGDIFIGGGTSQEEVFENASRFRKTYQDVQFHFYCDEAYNVMERLDHGSLDFAVLLEPIDTMKYDYLTLTKVSYWGLLVPQKSALSSKEVITPQDIKNVPLIVHQREELQRELALWANMEVDEFNIAATFNVIHGSCESYVKSGLGYLLVTDDLIGQSENQDVCFKYLEPRLPVKQALVWKRYNHFNPICQKFLNEMRKNCRK